MTSGNARKITELGLAGMEPEPGRLGVGEFAFPGPLRDQLVAAIIAGTKTTTTGLLADYEMDAEPLPRPGDRQVVIDSAGIPVALIEIVDARVVRVGDIDLAHAVGEGEGYASVAAWRSGHEGFWHSRAYREFRGDPAFTVNDDTLAVAQQFRVVADDHHDLGSLLQRVPEGVRVDATARDAAGEDRERERLALPGFLENGFIAHRRMNGTPALGSPHIGDTIHGIPSHLLAIASIFPELSWTGAFRHHDAGRASISPLRHLPYVQRMCLSILLFSARRGSMRLA